MEGVCQNVIGYNLYALGDLTGAKTRARCGASCP